MGVYAGLDISDKQTHLCLVEPGGSVVWRGHCATDPDVIAKTLSKRYRPSLAQTVLKTGPLSAFLFHGLKACAVPAVCICARHAKVAL